MTLPLPERLDVPPHLAQRPDFLPGDLVLPCLQPGRLVQVLAVVDAPGPLPGPRLGPAGVLRGLLAQQPPGTGRRRVTVGLLVLLQQPVKLGRDAPGPGREHVRYLLGHAADLGAVAVLTWHHVQPAPDQPGLHLAVDPRRDPQPHHVQRPPVDAPPPVIGAVSPQGQVRDRGVNVQLRVTVPGDVVDEQRRDQPGRVPPLPRRGRVVPGPDERGALLRVGDSGPGRVDQVLLDAVRQLGEPSRELRVSGLARGHLERGVQHGDRLHGRDGQVEVRHLDLARA